jgi:hypothetical protein
MAGDQPGRRKEQPDCLIETKRNAFVKSLAQGVVVYQSSFQTPIRRREKWTRGPRAR